MLCTSRRKWYGEGCTGAILSCLCSAPCFMLITNSTTSMEWQTDTDILPLPSTHTPIEGEREKTNIQTFRHEKNHRRKQRDVGLKRWCDTVKVYVRCHVYDCSEPEASVSLHHKHEFAKSSHLTSTSHKPIVDATIILQTSRYHLKDFNMIVF